VQFRVRQIYFREDQKPYLCKKFEPYDNTRDKSEINWFEYGVIRSSYHEQFYASAKYTGVLSWRFSQKSGISGEEFLKFVRSNPGYDVYFINPFPEEELSYPNIWLQGEKSHPGLLKVFEKISARLSLNIKPQDLRFNPSEIAYCNYWLGNEKFWKKYIAFSEPFARVIENDAQIRKLVTTSANYHYPAPLLPFLMERLFSTMLHLDPDIKSFKFKYPPKILNAKFAARIVQLESLLGESNAFKLGHSLLNHRLQFLKLVFRLIWQKVFRKKLRIS